MMETNLEEAEEKVPKTELLYDGEVGKCRCGELEARSKKAEASCLELELEVRKRKSEYEALETKARTLQAAKLALDNEIKILRSRNNEGAVDLTEESDEEDKVFQLMAENKVLECEKSMAENEAEAWKRKFRELESLTLQLQKSLVLKSAEQPFDTKNPDVNKTNGAVQANNGGSTLNDMPVIVGALSFVDSVPTLISPGKGAGNLQPAGTPSNDAPYKADKGDYRMQCSKRVRRPLSFQEERGPNKQMAPSTPAGVKPASVGIIDIHDSDDEPTVDGKVLSKHELGAVDCENETGAIGNWNQEEKQDAMQGSGSFCPEIDKGRGAFTIRKRRLVLLSQSEVKEKNCSSNNNSGRKFIKGTPMAADVEDDDSDGTASDSDDEGDSLNGFIVEDSNATDCDSSCNESQDGSDCNDARSGQEDVSSGRGACSDSKDASNDEVDFDVIFSQIRRNKDHRSDMKFEGELLAAFGKISKAALCHNQRGFSKFDAYRGCTLAEFLTDGDPIGDVKKSVKELEAYEPKGVELCRYFATRYSKQLFEIYKSKKDPYFLHS
ncbi:Folylpolyglutamate synthetase family protein isoform 1 [Hibiscus syriacus]|uniref:Folylpolyglutamate synthetase family protein isoform 1 n=1 Tax=Hibiscus syriacus TaxID=106335 RepID=A0A6A3D444_HIBSY|nr:Folylpolyglutamate synthetase family protein isoform 1 [Hibiscus syriacus]